MAILLDDRYHVTQDGADRVPEVSQEEQGSSPSSR